MSTVIRHGATVCLGEAGTVVGQLTYARSGARENATFAYDSQWLQSPDRFSLSPDLELTDGHQYHKAATKNDSVFHLAIADTEPDGWGCRVIARDHAKRRKAIMEQGAAVPSASLTQWDYLVGVDDFSRIGALRLRDGKGNFLRTSEDGERATPALLELAHLLGASQAVERGTETEADLRYLRGRGTSLGGLRPKCTVIDEDGHLAIANFRASKMSEVTKGEVLALRWQLPPASRREPHYTEAARCYRASVRPYEPGAASPICRQRPCYRLDQTRTAPIRRLPTASFPTAQTRSGIWPSYGCALPSICSSPMSMTTCTTTAFCTWATSNGGWRRRST